MSEQLVVSEHAGAVATLTLNNPKKRNALSSDLMRSLIDGLNGAVNDGDIRVIIIRAEGHVFSAGHDLRELQGGSRESCAEVFELINRLMRVIRDSPKPVIAQVDGLATAAGCQLVAACDLAVCSEDSAFATPGVKVGLFCSTPAVPVARALPQKKTMEMLLTAAPMSAVDAERFGLVNRVVPKDELESTTQALAKLIAGWSPDVVALGKQAFYKQVDMECSAAYDFAAGVMVENLAHPDAQEGINAFVEKRRPAWAPD